jgi:hypothetical protein
MRADSAGVSSRLWIAFGGISSGVLRARSVTRIGITSGMLRTGPGRPEGSSGPIGEGRVANPPAWFVRRGVVAVSGCGRRSSGLRRLVVMCWAGR